jgi:hypothetical protein
MFTTRGIIERVDSTCLIIHRGDIMQSKNDRGANHATFQPTIFKKKSLPIPTTNRSDIFKGLFGILNSSKKRTKKFDLTTTQVFVFGRI